MADDKARMRREARRRRGALAAAEADAALRAAHALPQALLRGVRAAALYRAMGSELDPTPLAARLTAAGIAVLLPAVVARDAPLVFRLAQGPLRPDAAGLPAPGVEAAALEPDLVFAPLLAFDGQGGRLGWGGGYYDRTLAALRGRRPVLAVGLAYSGQEVARVPAAAHDEKLDAILTELGYRPFLVKDV